MENLLADPSVATAYIIQLSVAQSWDYVKVFCLGLMIDFAWTYYIGCVGKRHLAAVFWSLVIAIPSMIGYFVSYDNKVMMVPYFIGLGLGTYIGSVRTQKQQTNV